MYVAKYYELIIVDECDLNNNPIKLIVIKCGRLSTLSKTRVMPFGGIGEAFINYVSARLLKN